MQGSVGACRGSGCPLCTYHFTLFFLVLLPPRCVRMRPGLCLPHPTCSQVLVSMQVPHFCAETCPPPGWRHPCLLAPCQLFLPLPGLPISPGSVQKAKGGPAAAWAGGGDSRPGTRGKENHVLSPESADPESLPGVPGAPRTAPLCGTRFCRSLGPGSHHSRLRKQVWEPACPLSCQESVAMALLAELFCLGKCSCFIKVFI